jgi:hypothetical protein
MLRDHAFDNFSFRDEFYGGKIGLIPMPSPDALPEGVVDRIADGSVLEQYRAGKDMACEDIIIGTHRPDGTPVVMLSLRKPTESFGGKWWVYGGSTTAYADVLEFIAKRAERECGVPVVPQGLIGFYRTCAADKPQSTLQPCFGAVVDYSVVDKKMATDPNHESIRLFTLEELDQVPEEQRHWYPRRVAKLLLIAMQS